MQLEALALRSSGRAVLLENEIERCIASQVDLKFYDGTGGVETAPAEKYEVQYCTRASAPQPGCSCWIPLAAVNTWEISSSVAARFNLKREKVKLQLFVTLDRKPAPGGIDAVRMTHVGLSFRTGLPPIFAEHMTKAMAEEKWKSSVAAAPAPADVPEDLPKGVHPHDVQQLTEMGFGRNRAIRALMATGNRSVPDAMDWAIAFQHDPSADAPLDGTETFEGRRKIIKSGLGDIFKREEEKQKQTTQALDDAFQDLNSLMSKAEEMVKLADRFYSSFAKDSATATAEEADMEQDTIRELISMGITSPVTKEAAGNLYHDQLCRQLADFLESRLEQQGGVMTLLDVYSLYNRARGAAELVSPDDLMQAAQLFPKLKIPFKMRTFTSGVRVIQSGSHDEAAVCARIEDMVRTETGGLSHALSPIDIALKLHVPLSIAQEHLLLAERHEILCRDDGPGGLRFYNNIFKDM